MEEVEGSGSEIWMTEDDNMVILDVMDDVFYPKEETLKVSCWRVNKGGYLENIKGSWLETWRRGRVILDVIYDVFLP